MRRGKQPPGIWELACYYQLGLGILLLNISLISQNINIRQGHSVTLMKEDKQARPLHNFV